MKAMEQPQECEEKLTKLPEGEAHSLLLRLINAENEIGSTLTLENFILGFRLGSRLILESLVELFQAPGGPRKTCDANQR